MPKPTLIFYIDLHSPYSYIAYMYIRKSPVFKACEIKYVPVQLVAMAKLGISTPPWSSPNKVDYLQRDVGRWARQMNIPWGPGFPANYPKTRTSDVQRAVTACGILFPYKVEAVLDVLYPAFWAEKKGIQLPEVFEPMFVEVLGKDDAEKVMNYAASEEVRSTLQKNTQNAIAEGATGLPWFTAVNSTGEKDQFWGFHTLGQVAGFLGLESVPAPHL